SRAKSAQLRDQARQRPTHEPFDGPALKVADFDASLNLLFALALVDELTYAGAEGLEVRLPLREIFAGSYLAMARNDGLELQLEHFIERVVPIQSAAAGSVIDEGRAAHEHIAGVNDSQLREVDDRVPVGV